MKLIYRADTIIEAQLLVGLLEQSGIAAHAGGHYLQGAVGDIAPVGIANVFVGDDDEAAARDIIEGYERGDFTTPDTIDVDED
ncbi:hypothetical protein CWE22_01335 [Pseudidiomarina aestuarii]|uniref:DUF2007 domain-containing protein n=1 Tax=Pseudidiomarina aestuarii TaxID=624146 RepID=A0A7Z7ET94_9GAMM|nr:DUF2007 domain-containing protein [Pseudidiomarina aestuarii]RUO40868.1 hypothetical protein CWE22_01335 [Pseudidiomarina aestuarii]